MPDEKKQFEELTIKFGKGLAEDFTGKDGKAYKRILIPNADPADHSPWASFVLPAKAVHENQYGKPAPNASRPAARMAAGSSCGGRS